MGDDLRSSENGTASSAGSEADPPPSTAAITAKVTPTFSFAAYQNSVPVIRVLQVTNPSGATKDNLVLEVESSPAFVRRKQWRIDRLLAGQSLTIQDRDLQIDSDFLRGLNEAERGELRFRLRDASGELADAVADLRVLARDEWGGMANAGELLAAFVMPNDAAIARILKTASRILAEANRDPSLSGYQTVDPKNAYLQIAAVWSAVTGENLTYANPPSSFEKQGQKTRPPERVLRERLATCLDTTLLFAAAIEALGLHPVIVLRNHHCFVGGWLRETNFPETLNRLASEVRKAIAAHDLVVFETTLVTHHPPGRFEQAVREARAQLGEDEENAFIAALDITRARMAGVQPLASHRTPSAGSAAAAAETTGPVPLANTPEFEQLPEEQTEEKPTTPDGRIDRWQRKLLDLSLRNRLLNFKDTKQTMLIECPDISELEDHLARGKQVKIISAMHAHAVEGRDDQLYRQRVGNDVLEQFTRRAWSNREVVSPLSDGELSTRLTNIYRAARSDMAEGGSNTLYLAVGFLRWRQQPSDQKTYRAPLLLMPVKLTRRSAVSTYELSAHEDDVRFNATLIQLLKKDFDLDLTEFEGDLPGDESGVDVPKIMRRVRQRVRNAPGFEVVDELALGTFSFVKYLLWKDMVDRLDRLEQNRVVRHLVRDPDKVYRTEDRGQIPSSNQVDTHFEPHELIHPLPADSSQLAAVMAAAQGHDFVLIGPPGTGKSQTIANMIAQCLAENKTVLFVAEKTAALDVVYRRLCQHGLGHSCLELHSNKSDRKHFLSQLRQAWQTLAPSQLGSWQEINTKLKERRDQLNRYVTELHRKAPCGWTVFSAMGRVVRDAALESPEFRWSAETQHDAAGYRQLRETVRDLGLTFSAVEPSPHLEVVHQAEWSVRWETELTAAAGQLQSTSAELAVELQPLLDALGMEAKQVRNIGDMQALLDLIETLRETASIDCRLMFDKKFAKFDNQLKRLGKALAVYHAARDGLSADYPDEVVPEIPIESMEAQWREAVARVWPVSILARRKVTRVLTTYSKSGPVNVEHDLPRLKQLQQALAEISGNLLAGKTEHWHGPLTNVSALHEHFETVCRTRRQVVSLGQRFDNLESISRKLAPALADTSGRHPLLTIIDRVRDQAERWSTAVDVMQERCGYEFAGSIEGNLLAKLESLGAGLQQDRAKLRRWTAWCGVRKQAQTLRLEPCVEALQKGHISPDQIVDRFELGYARWWLPLAIDRSGPLRSFQGFQHADAIEQFRRLDDEARQNASSKVSEAACHDLPPEDRVSRRSELGLLRHQMNLQRPSKAIREVIAGMPSSFSKLARCVLMSPLSIAQYLPTDHPPFDVVIFDEASQITTWDAIGAIARAKQTIIVGDPKQLPPTNFFGRADNSADDEGLEEYQQDLESILDETKAAGLPVLDLKWHYRSRHESLITFSNHRYYDNQLITFPTAEQVDCGVEFRHIAEGIYDRGTSRTNRAEAEAIVAEAVSRMMANLERPEEERLTFGIVTFNQTQQVLIQDLFDQALRENAKLEWYFSDDRVEPTVVKNLENVQGDERDVIMFSITYGRDSAGTFYRNFGALNRAGGQRRLNVAVTRARQLMLVFASFKADELDVSGLSCRGVTDLKHFLDFAEKGAKVLAAPTEGSQGEIESPLEEAVATALRAKGWRVVPQVGVSRFRIDLGIVHPHREGCFLAGIECDGATYHRSATARDRDKIREQVLRNLGWEIIRIWSPDWWYDATGALERVDETLRALLDAWEKITDDARPSDASTAGVPEAPAEEALASADENRPSSRAPSIDGYKVGDHDGKVLPDSPVAEVTNAEATWDEPQLVVKETSTTTPIDTTRSADTAARAYRVCDLSEWDTEPESFYDARYDDRLQEMLNALLEAEGPLHEDLVAQRVARAHGWTRTGKRIKQRVFDQLAAFTKTTESTGHFYWAEEEAPETIPFRMAACEEDRRAIEHISIAELCGALNANVDVLQADDPEGDLGRALGYSRVTRNMRQRLHEALERTRETASTD